MREIVKYKKGSSLLLIIVVMSVLMILGTAMLSLSLSSYKFRALEQNKKTSLYASEAGLDEAYEIMGTFVQYGIGQGNKAVEAYDKNFDSLIKVERYKVEHSIVSNYINEKGVITNETVEADKKRVFEEGYKVSTTQSSSNDYKEDGVRVVPDIECYDTTGSVEEKGYKDFIETGLSSGQGVFKEDDKLSQGGMVNLIDLLNTYSYQINVSVGDDKNVNANVNLAAKTFVKETGSDVYNPIEISVQSKYTHNSIPKTVKATYDIYVAKYNVQYNLLPTQIVKIPKNPIWSKALMVNGDMNINGGSVVIGNESEPTDPNNTGIYVTGKQTGIAINNESSTLKVIGNVVTNKNLMLSYNGDNTTGNNNVDVAGNIYAKNVFFNKSTVTDDQGNITSGLEAKGGKVYTHKIDDIRDGSVYLMDDLEINGEKSTVAIAGSYYGVSDGSEGERNNPDNSSSIIINTEDIGNKKEMDNDGDEVIDPNSYKSNLTIGKNLYIAGTSYINLVEDKKYQTGESISIVGNYRAYTQPLTNPINEQFKEDNVIFEYIDPLTLVTKYNEGESDSARTVKAILEEDRYVTVNLTDIGNADETCKDTYSYNIIYNNNEQSKIVPIGKTVKLNTVINNLENTTNKPEVTVRLYKLGNILIKEEPNLRLVASIKMNAFDKNKYFQEYVNQFSQSSGLNLGEGININTNHTNTNENINAGSISTTPQNSGDPISSGNWNIGLDMKVKARSIQLKNQLFYMGLAKDYAGLVSTTNVDDINDSSGIVDSNYYGIDDINEPEVKINGNVHFDSLTPKCEEKNGEIVILDNNINSTHVLGSNAGNAQGNFNVTDLEGIIITNGNIIISGELNFKGTIICNGDITFEGDGDKKIAYDKAYLENYALNNYQLFKDTFSDVGEYARDNASNYLFAKIYDNSNSTDTPVDEFKLINRKKWELIK
ncbi:hypothetical protein [Clostridium sp.]